MSLCGRAHGIYKMADFIFKHPYYSVIHLYQLKMLRISWLYQVYTAGTDSQTENQYKLLLFIVAMLYSISAEGLY